MTADELERLDRERREADARYNDALTALDRAIGSMDGRALSRDDVARVGTALLGFLQQITAFVESKDRQLAADATARAEAIARALEPVDELRVQITVLRRAVEALSSHQSSDVGEQSAINQQSAISNQQSRGDDYKYVGFEDQFRGSDAAIEEQLRAYVPLFAG